MNIFKNTAKKILKNLGYKLSKITNSDETAENNSMLEGIIRFKHLLNDVSTVIDVGAASGTWTEKIIPKFNDVDYLLVEPLHERKVDLEALASKFPKIKLLFKALGRCKGTLPFTVADDLDGSGFYENGNLREIETIDLDSVVNEFELKGPFILKLDTHGFEVPIFDGAPDTLSNTVLLIVEVYGFRVAPNSLLFWELTQYLDNLGFRLYDIVEVMRRPKDQAFWQCDAFFLQKTNPIFNSNIYG